MLDQRRRESITIHDGVTVERVAQGSSIRISMAGPQGAQIVEGSHLLIATGRRPRVEALDLQAGGVAVGPQGIAVDKRLMTTNWRVYALGNVYPSPSVQPRSYHAELVLRNALFRLAVNGHSGVIPAMIYTDPELAEVGLTADQARARHRSIRVLSWPTMTATVAERAIGGR